MRNLLLHTSQLTLSLLGLLGIGLLHLLPSGAYFSSQVLGSATFNASFLSIDLKESEPLPVTPLLPGQSASAKLLLENTGPLDINYLLALDSFTGGLCSQLEAEVSYHYYDFASNLIVLPLYQGDLTALTDVAGAGIRSLPNSFVYQPNGDYTQTEHWLELTLGLPSDSGSLFHNQSCQFEMEATAWQSEFESIGGFTDSDSLSFSISAGVWDVCIPGLTYPDNVTVNQAKRKNGTNVLAARSDPETVKGQTDNQFYSLGFGGVMVLEFETRIDNGPGFDLGIAEVTNGRSTYPEELATVEVSQDGESWIYLGQASSRATSGLNRYDLDTIAMPWIRFMRLTDVSNPGPFEATADGFDIDSIQAYHNSCEVPEFACSRITGLVSEATTGTPLSDQQVVMRSGEMTPIQTLTISATNPNTINTQVLDSDKTYLLELSGTWTNQSGARRVDGAGYYSDNNWVSFSSFRQTAGRSPKQLTVVLDETFVDWGNYNTDHRYKIALKGEGQSLSLRIFDGDNDPNPPSWYGDNNGSLALEIYDVSGQVAVTDEDGRYSLQSCYPGTHQLVWIDQPYFTQASPVTPDYYHFNQMNLAPSYDFGLTAMPWGFYSFNSPLTASLRNLYGFSGYELSIEYQHTVDEATVSAGIERSGSVDNIDLDVVETGFESCSDSVCVPHQEVSIIKVLVKLLGISRPDQELTLEAND